jgi:hypothetical protein
MGGGTCGLWPVGIDRGAFIGLEPQESFFGLFADVPEPDL